MSGGTNVPYVCAMCAMCAMCALSVLSWCETSCKQAELRMLAFSAGFCAGGSEKPLAQTKTGMLQWA